VVYPAGPRPGGVGGRAALRVSLPRARHPELADPAPARPAQLGHTGDRPGVAGRRRGDPDRLRAVLPRARHAGPHAGLGADGGRGPELLHHPVVSGDVPRPGHLDHRARFQPARRRAARRARSPKGAHPMSPAKLEVRDLRVSFAGHPVASVPELNVDGGEIVGLAGESGSGKSMTILAVLGLAGTAGAAVTGSVRLDGQELIGPSGARLRAIRGRRIAAIFQSPALAFNPVFRVGAIVSRTLRQHGLSGAEATARAHAAMRSVLLPLELLATHIQQLYRA